MKIGTILLGAGVALYLWSELGKAKAALSSAELEAQALAAATELQAAADLALAALETEQLKETVAPAPVFAVPMLGQEASSKTFSILPKFGS